MLRLARLVGFGQTCNPIADECGRYRGVGFPGGINRL